MNKLNPVNLRPSNPGPVPGNRIDPIAYAWKALHRTPLPEALRNP